MSANQAMHSSGEHNKKDREVTQKDISRKKKEGRRKEIFDNCLIDKSSMGRLLCGSKCQSHVVIG
jgi:hypothetical protein